MFCLPYKLPPQFLLAFFICTCNNNLCNIINNIHRSYCLYSLNNVKVELNVKVIKFYIPNI